MSKIKKNSSSINSISLMLSKLYKEKYGKSYMLWKVIGAIFDSLASITYIIVPGLIINELTERKNIYQITLLVAILILTPLASYLKNISIDTYLQKKKMNLVRVFNIRFQDHIADMKYETLEKPDVRVLKQRAGVTAPAPVYMFDRLIPLLIAIINLFVMSTIIFTLHPLIILLIVFVVLINSLVTKRINDKNFENKKEISTYNNFYYTHFYDLSDTSSAKEVRLYDIKNFFIDLFTQYGIKIDKLTLKDEVYRKKLKSIHVSTGIIQQLILYLYLIYRVLTNSLAIGSMTIYLSTVSKISSTLTTIFNQYLDIKRYCLDISEYIDFMKIPTYQEESGMLTPAFNNESIIEFKGVSFKYPGSDRYALKNINLKIYGNQKLCIVGANGSGKSTFIKLITRLYEPSEGEILLNDVNIKKYNIKEYHKIFAPVFQDYYLYNLSLLENITLSKNYNILSVQNILAQSGLSSLVTNSPKREQTQIWKNLESDGIEPSGGEGQKIAIARAIFRNSPVYLLDEPTAALDPMAEYEIYTQFNKMITDKCAVLITHRLSAVQLADKVAVFDNGSVAEYGTHKELYEKGGIYTEMFNKQAQFYRDEKKSEN